MAKQFIRPPGVYCPPGRSPAVRTGDTIYFTGQVAHDAEGNVVGKGDMKAQLFANLEKVLEAAGASLSDIVKLNLYTPDWAALEQGGAEIYQHIRKPYPAMTGVEVSSLADPDLLIEIDGVAVVDE
ncbi:MAG: RidA family protein [Deltaproteobacteria bacterium]|nr:RidA family protein [Deltaproteobacteria bacterium]